MKNSQKIEILDATLQKLSIAMEHSGGRKVILDFMPAIGYENQLDFLKELKRNGVIESFEKDEDSFYILHPVKAKLYGIKNSLISNRKSQQIEKPKKLSFDLNDGRIIWGNKQCELPFKSFEYYIMEALFKKPTETKISEDDLITHIDIVASKTDNPSRVYDGVRRINQKVLKNLGIENFIQHKGSNFWLRKIE